MIWRGIENNNKTRTKCYSLFVSVEKNLGVNFIFISIHLKDTGLKSDANDSICTVAKKNKKKNKLQKYLLLFCIT